MKRKIPSTVALAVFDAAARYESFARAATELCLTESAVSRQIAALENYLGVRLFERVKKQVVLSEAGRHYSRTIAVNLDEIELHTRSLMAHKGAGGVLELAVIPTFANRWLLPRLHEFRRQYPDITLNLSERPEPFPFRGTIFDAALHFDSPSWVDVVKIELFEEAVVPVLNPAHFDVSRLSSPRELLGLPLLHKSTRADAWPRWFELAGHRHEGPVPGMRFELYGMVIEAARAGLGVGLVPRFYVQDEINRGDLVIPFDIALKHMKRYCLVFPEYKQDSPLVAKLRDWIVATAGEFDRARA
ncbi:MAG: LysR family transcriptional regulator [Burkholderiales bacterium]|nr:LysR family transcriptional regulator [Burkholderiales bacterium]OJX08183.1 MAG: LysR family transcriptional regulator [Burkholderiales bacterium 70-64]